MSVKRGDQPQRWQAILWARSLMARRFLVLDTETTGLGKNSEIVQIGIIDSGGKVVMDQLLKPRRPIPWYVSNIHGISNEDVADAPTFLQVYVELSSAIAAQPIIAYNMDFDWRLLCQTSAQYGLPELRTGKRGCAMKQYARYRLRRGIGCKKQGYAKLVNAVRHEGLELGRAHNALSDARMTLALVRKMAASS